MSSRDWRHRVEDILAAIAEIESFTSSLSFEQFTADTRTIKAVELDFIVIGEAAIHIPGIVQSKHPEVPWALMRAMRNRLVHVYFEVDPAIVWETVQNDLPPLVEPLRQLLIQTEDT
jgi:uncharacterized protein with HEPN domain